VTAKTILQSVVQYGTGRRANTGDTGEFGKTGTTEDNGDAWFVGVDGGITVAIWVGFPNSVKPMLTEYNGAPVDGGTIPAELFYSIVTAFQQLQADRAAGQKSSLNVPDTSVPSYGTSTTAPSTAPTTEPSTGGGGGGTNQTAPATNTPPATDGGSSGGTPPSSSGGAVGAG
jgi:penicillin-binding protein 1A